MDDELPGVLLELRKRTRRSVNCVRPTARHREALGGDGCSEGALRWRVWRRNRMAEAQKLYGDLAEGGPRIDVAVLVDDARFKKPVVRIPRGFWMLQRHFPELVPYVDWWVREVGIPAARKRDASTGLGAIVGRWFDAEDARRAVYGYD